MKLSLPEQLLLVALDDEKGREVQCTGTALHYAIAGTVVYELLQRNMIEKVGKLMLVKHGVRTGDEVLDLIIEYAGHQKKPRSMGFLIQQFSGKAEKIKSILLERLVAKGILEKEEHRFLWMIPYDRYPIHNIAPENEIRKRMVDVILDRVEMEESDCILLSLIRACDLEKEVFPKELLKQAKSRIKTIAKDEKIGKAVSEIASQIQVAMTVAITAATVVTIT